MAGLESALAFAASHLVLLPSNSTVELGTAAFLEDSLTRRCSSVSRQALLALCHTQTALCDAATLSVREVTDTFVIQEWTI